ncbi:MAG: hypothetical protein AAGD92_02265 [Pseudomonadota bacterium]
MKAVLWLVVLLLAATGVAAIVDYTGVYDVPMVAVTKQVDTAADAISSFF